ncbi:hypothetical protein Ahy_A03g012636 [Arachis hypogaea]|uniref:Uncharacterized protein n=1 Tax=Arachis hypogaea TaxID=3818 RepID=A0A445DU06_ARAHY|nr:hypothetical protein Ahy_A03g012636 [Arachis hypogaea]
MRRREDEEPSRTATASPSLSRDGGGSRCRRHRAREKERGLQWSEKEVEIGTIEKEARDRDETDRRHHRWCGRSCRRRRLKRRCRQSSSLPPPLEMNPVVLLLPEELRATMKPVKNEVLKTKRSYSEDFKYFGAELSNV